MKPTRYIKRSFTGLIYATNEKAIPSTVIDLNSFGKIFLKKSGLFSSGIFEKTVGATNAD